MRWSVTGRIGEQAAAIRSRIVELVGFLGEIDVFGSQNAPASSRITAAHGA